MTDQEFERFVKRLFVSFPDLYEWLHNNSPDPLETQVVWFETLKTCSSEECLHVLSDWIEGRRPVFKAYERGQVALLIRQSVYFDRDKLAKRMDCHSKTADYAKTKRGEYRSAMEGVPGLGEIFRKGCELRQRMVDGEITEEQMRQEQWRLIDSVQ